MQDQPPTPTLACTPITHTHTLVTHTHLRSKASLTLLGVSPTSALLPRWEASAHHQSWLFHSVQLEGIPCLYSSWWGEKKKEASDSTSEPGYLGTFALCMNDKDQRLRR